jgi:hypothetical protein
VCLNRIGIDRKDVLERRQSAIEPVAPSTTLGKNIVQLQGWKDPSVVPYADIGLPAAG